VRKNNEDAMAAFTFDGRHTQFLGRQGSATLTDGDFVFMVTDGMGGEKLGEFASRTAIDQIARLLPRSFRLSARGMNNGFQDILTEAVDSAHKAIIKLGWAYEECWGMGTTLSLAWFTPAWMYFAHVGDSRIYHLPRGGPLKQITHDHNQAGWLRRKGQINEREARSHPTRHSLQQSLGGGNQFVDPHIGAVGLQPGDRFLVCSDGLIDGLWDHHLVDILGAELPLPDLNRKMVDLALENSGRDNTTAIVVEVRADAPEPAPK
jgi:protein phosphatase